MLNPNPETMQHLHAAYVDWCKNLGTKNPPRYALLGRAEYSSLLLEMNQYPIRHVDHPWNTSVPKFLNIGDATLKVIPVPMDNFLSLTTGPESFNKAGLLAKIKPRDTTNA